MSKENYLKNFKDSIKLMENEVIKFPWQDDDFYKMWLSQTYFIVRHTSHFVCLAAGLTPVENRSEHYFLIEHLKEEEHHDQLLISDLKHLKTKAEEFPELTETALVWQNLYYWLSLRKPRAILGHSLCIEGLAGHIGPKLLPILQNKYNQKSTSFLRVHFEADKKHFEQGLQKIQEFPIEDVRDISKVQTQSSILYLNMLKAIAKHCQQKKPFDSAA